MFCEILDVDEFYVSTLAEGKVIRMSCCWWYMQDYREKEMIEKEGEGEKEEGQEIL